MTQQQVQSEEAQARDPLSGADLLDWLDTEVDELNVAKTPAEILDEVVDVIYVARRYAFNSGLTPAQIRDYAKFKGASRLAVGKDRDLELAVANAVVNRNS